MSNMVNAPINTPDTQKGEGAKRNAMICSIIGFFFAGFIFGTIAVVQANKARDNGVDAGGWKILAWVDIIVWAIAIVMRLAG